MSSILDIIFPPKCIGCSEVLTDEASGSPFCPFCLAKWEKAKNERRIASYGQPVRLYKQGDKSKDFGKVLYLVDYVPGEKDRIENCLILKLKDKATGRIVDFTAAELASVIRTQIPLVCEDGTKRENTVITWIPRRRSSVNQRGFDHMERVAKALSRKLDIPYANMLKRRFNSAEQKSLTHKQRRQNAERGMYINEAVNIKGKTVLLIDDIITSGASIDRATKLLKEKGAWHVFAVAVSATERPAEKPTRADKVFNIIKK